MTQQFLRAHRMLATADFQRAFKSRTSVADGVLVVYGYQNGLEHSRLGCSVSRKVGNAVVRNRWKRLIRESFRQQQGELPSGLDYVVIPRKDIRPSQAEVATSLAALARRVERKIRRRSADRQSKGEADG